MSQYLYQTKRLDLPGIGSFTLDAAAVLPQESDRLGQVVATGIQFKNATIPAADDALVSYIKERTGKMKSLAAADLDFFLTTGRQLLNIGKPFYIEGIGTLLKNKEGKLEYTPGEYLVTRLDDLHHPDRRTAAPAMGYDEPPREDARGGGNSGQTLLLIGIIAGIAIIAFGGYYLYKRNNYAEPAAENRARVVPESTATAAADTSAQTPMKPADSNQAVKKDTTTVNTQPIAAIPPAVQHEVTAGTGQSLYHFVILRTENKNHALRRYNQLLGYQLNIHMETKDSSFFKLYFPIAATIADTTHIRDSLADVYASRITIEKY